MKQKDNMTQKFNDTIEKNFPELKQEISDITPAESVQAFETGNKVLQTLNDFTFAEECENEDEDPIVFDVFDYDTGSGLYRIPVEIWPMSPLKFYGSKENAVLLSPTGDRQFIAVRVSNRDVYEIILSILTDTKNKLHCRENTGELHRGLLEYTIYRLHNEAVKVYMTEELVEDLLPMGLIDYDYYIKTPVVRKSQGGDEIFDSLSALIRSDYGGIGFFLTNDDSDINIREYVIEFDRKLSMILQYCNRIKSGYKYTLVILPDELRACAVSSYFTHNKRCLDCTVTYADKAQTLLATGKFERVILLDVLHENILGILREKDVVKAIRNMDIAYGIAYGSNVLHAPHPLFFKLQTILGPIRVAI